MAKPTKHAGTICTILTILALVGIALGLLTSNALVIVLFLVPTVVYEVYRTEGDSTRWASWVLLLVLAAEIVFIVFHVNFDLAGFLGETSRTVAGYEVPLGDVKAIGPAIMAVLSVILIVRTRGRYTKWLAAIILVTSFSIVYGVDPTLFSRLLQLGVNQGLDQIR